MLNRILVRIWYSLFTPKAHMWVLIMSRMLLQRATLHYPSFELLRGEKKGKNGLVVCRSSIILNCTRPNI